jgi:hypothetical protein
MLRHLTIAELLALRDGEGSAAAREHIETCGDCRVELDRAHQRVAALKALPSFSPPRDRWSTVREQLVTARRRRRLAGVRWVGLAAAAVIIGVLGVRAVPEPASAPVEELAAREVDALVEESRELEAVLASFQRPGRVVNGATAATIAALEDRIAAIDVGIERGQAFAVSSNSMADLWRERVVLMDQLVTTHVRQVRYVGH